MNCTVCGIDAPTMEHVFHEGDPQNPTRTWTIVAPLYFKADDTNTKCIEGYCGPVCSLKGLSNVERDLPARA